MMDPIRSCGGESGEIKVFVQALYQSQSLWWTFGGGTRLSVGSNALPSLSLLPPSTAELSAKRSATLLCLANKGFPSDWSLQWKIDGSSKSSSVTKTPGILESDGTYSWSSTLTLSEADWKSLHSVTCEASQGSQATVQKTLNKSDCPE
ncbi:KACB protein, partial [Atractosteus spatula]|nr:KACB protein [Atractosteus spatula]